jgi:hypothetical protein
MNMNRVGQNGLVRIFPNTKRSTDPRMIYFDAFGLCSPISIVLTLLPFYCFDTFTALSVSPPLEDREKQVCEKRRIYRASVDTTLTSPDRDRRDMGSEIWPSRTLKIQSDGIKVSTRG